jgi:hypothetical protein
MIDFLFLRVVLGFLNRLRHHAGDGESRAG